LRSRWRLIFLNKESSGARMTQICVSLIDETTTAVIDRMADLAADAR
jgi:hypothetical protein